MRSIPPLLALVAGLLLQDCVLLGGAVLLGLRTFHVGMDGVMLMPSWRVVSRCWAAGWLALVAAALLLIRVASVMAGRWEAANQQPWLAFLCLSTAVALAWAFERRGGRGRSAVSLAAGLAVAGLAWGAQREGVEFAPCLFATGAALVAGFGGWQLAKGTAEGLLEADRLR